MVFKISSMATGFTLAFLGGICGGIMCLSIDIDHVLVLIAKGLPITWENLYKNAGRPLHIPGMVFLGILFICTWTYLARLHFQG